MYTAVVLDKSSSEALEKFHMVGWKKFAHHMTISFGFIPDGMVEGTEVEMTIGAIGQNDLVRAAKVISSSIPSQNKVPHITISVDTENGGKPAMSNNITEWTEIPQFTVRGVVKFL